MKIVLLVASFLVLNTTFAEILIENAYIKTVPPGVNASAAFAKITNKGKKDIYLTAVKSDLAEFVEIHNTSMKDGMMEMRKIESLKVEANKTVELKPGGLHVMLIFLQKKLKAGDSHNLEFQFKSGKKITKKLPVKKID